MMIRKLLFPDFVEESRCEDGSNPLLLFSYGFEFYTLNF